MSLPRPRSIACIALLASAPLLVPAAASAQGAYPNRPIHFIVPLASGSAVDVAARIVAQQMSVSMGQSLVIENLPGAAGIVGADRVAKAAPDGYTIGGFNDSIMTMVPALQAKLPWDIVRDFTPVSLVATVEWGLVMNPAAPFGNVAGLIGAAKAAPGTIDYGSGGIGSPQHIAMALFASEANVTMNHVPYKGATQAAVGVAGAEVPVAFQGLATVNSLIRGNKLKLVAVSTPKRMPQYPDVPTVSESGLPGFEFNSWFAVLAPAGTAPEIVTKLNAEIVKALANPAVREQLVAQGLTPRGSSADELGRATRIQLAKYAALIKKNGIKAE
ncbi:MAG: tripartite tricarboxylate transporter substrate binding protein [Pseudomonadota bacterium]|nr:tripartite tricarboxylate transporter substrate binding protein [Pseudomonadota bacterium]